jgi:hypothetical protein
MKNKGFVRGGTAYCGSLLGLKPLHEGTISIVSSSNFQATEGYLWQSSVIGNQNGVLEVGNICYLLQVFEYYKLQ